MKIQIIYKNGKTKTVTINDNCSTEQLIAKIEKHEYNSDVFKVVVL